MSITTHYQHVPSSDNRGYRYQGQARAPIDAGKWCQVMEKERVIATRFFDESQ